jgi:hypothetical protein
MAYIFIEALYFLAWPAVVLTRLRRNSLAAIGEVLVLLMAIPLVALAEMVNEFLYAGTGVYYPRSLLYVPGLQFPVGILLSSSLYVWLLHVLARESARRVSSEDAWTGQGLYFVFFLILLSSYVIPEDLGVRLGYWAWRVPPPSTLQVWIAKYIFYFGFTFPSVLVAQLISWRLGRLQPSLRLPPPATRVSP